MALIIVGAVWLGVHLLTTPATGHVIPTSDYQPRSKKSTVSPAAISAGTLETAYFDMKLPVGYQPQPATPAVPGLLYQQTLLKPSSVGSLIVAMAVKTMPEGGLGNDSAYALRQQHPEQYSFTKQQVGGDTIVIVTDAQSAAVVAFWPHGTYVATLSVTSGVSTPGHSDASEEKDALQPLITAWRWR